MGCYNSKDISGSVISNNKISFKSYKINSAAEIKRNYFNAIGKNSWFNVVDFLSYKELYQVKNQNILAKFFRKKPNNFNYNAVKSSTHARIGNFDNITNVNPKTNTINNNSDNQNNNNVLLVNKFDITSSNDNDKFIIDGNRTMNKNYKISIKHFNKNGEETNYNYETNNILESPKILVEKINDDNTIIKKNSNIKEQNSLKYNDEEIENSYEKKITGLTEKKDLTLKLEMERIINKKNTKSSTNIQSELDKILTNDNNLTNRINLGLENNFDNQEDKFLKSMTNNTSKRNSIFNIKNNIDNIIENNFIEKNKIFKKEKLIDMVRSNNTNLIEEGDMDLNNLEIETYRSNFVCTERGENSDKNCFSKITDMLKLKKEIKFKKEIIVDKNNDKKNDSCQSSILTNINNDEKKSISLKEKINQNMKKEIFIKNEEFDDQNFNQNKIYVNNNIFNLSYNNQNREDANFEVNNHINFLKKNTFENNNFEFMNTDKIEKEIKGVSYNKNDNSDNNSIKTSSNQIYLYNLSNPQENNNKIINPSFMYPRERRKSKIKKSHTDNIKTILSNLDKNYLDINYTNNLNPSNKKNFTNSKLIKSNLQNIRLNSASSGQNNHNINNKNNIISNEIESSNLDLEKETLNLLENLNYHSSEKDFENSANNSSSNKNLNRHIKSPGTSSSNNNNNSNSNPVIITNNYIQLYINNNSNIPYIDYLTNKELEFKEVQNPKFNMNRENSSVDVTPSFKFTDNELSSNSNFDDFQNNYPKNLDITNTSNIFNNVTNNSQIGFLNDINNANNNINQMNANNHNFKENISMDNFNWQKNLNSNSRKYYNTKGMEISQSNEIFNNNNNFSNNIFNLTSVSNGVQYNNQIQFKEKNNKNQSQINNLNTTNNNQILHANGNNEIFFPNGKNKTTFSNKVKQNIANMKSWNTVNDGFTRNTYSGVLYHNGNHFSGMSIVRDLKNIPDFDQISGIDLDKERDENFLNISNQNVNFDIIRRVKSYQNLKSIQKENLN